MTTNLLLALHAEHKQRTGHDCTKNLPHQQLTNIMCDVCLNLRAEFRALEKAEADHYEQQAKEANEPIKADLSQIREVNDPELGKRFIMFQEFVWPPKPEPSEP